jgi:hypothetical protein
MKLCMFSPPGHNFERGWPGKIEGDRVIQVAAQTLEAFFAGGGKAREHAEYPLDEVQLLPPVLHPPSIRIFDAPDRFEFANPAAIVGPEATVQAPGELEAHARVCAVMGAEHAIGGFTLMADFRAPALPAPKDRDFALGLGPAVVTPDEAPESELDWDAAVSLAARNTRLVPGDLLAAPSHEIVRPDEVLELELEGIGILRNRIRQPDASE